MNRKVLIPEEVSRVAITYLEENGFECICLDDCSFENKAKYIADCDAILARNSEYRQELISKADKLKIIARHGVGLDNMDLDYIKSRGIVITNTPGANANSVAEHTVAMILACAKNIPVFDKLTRDGDWTKRDTDKTTDVAGKTLGLIGYGNISSMVAKKAGVGLDMKILVYRTHHSTPLPDYITEVESLDELLKASDFVSLHTPLRPDTVNIINKDTLALMKPNAYFINMARGGNVNEEDLYEALSTHSIAGAAIDVFAQEPPAKDNPLFALDNIILSPHNAAHTYESMDRMALGAATEIVRYFNGESPIYPV